MQDAIELKDTLRERAHPLRETEDLDPLLERIGDARCVLLGEASHGTSEYYTWRARISERLIREKGFSFIAVEGDWPDCYEVNRYVKGYPDSGKSAREVLKAFERWPTWMWANEEIVGQLVREQRGVEDVVLVGFGSHRGSVIAGAQWGAPMKRMPVPPAREGRAGRISSTVAARRTSW